MAEPRTPHMTHKSYRYGEYEYQLWDFRESDFLEDPEEDVDFILRSKGQDAAWRQEAYDDYLCSDYWERVRAAMFAKHNGRCQACGKEYGLQVHHKTYPRRFTELQNLHMLELLCDQCHHQSH
jgi:5-methylcytosine-specific restriction endonuclease McrA